MFSTLPPPSHYQGFGAAVSNTDLSSRAAVAFSRVMPGVSFRRVYRGLCPFAVAVALLSGCWGKKDHGVRTIRADELVVHGPTHYRSTLYLGSDASYHHFKWIVGSEFGRWRVPRSGLRLPCERPLGKSLVLTDDSWKHGLCPQGSSGPQAPAPSAVVPVVKASEPSVARPLSSLQHPVIAHPLEVEGEIAGDVYRGRYSPVNHRTLRELFEAEVDDVSFVSTPSTVRFFGTTGLVGTLPPTGARLQSGCGGAAVLEFTFASERPQRAILGIAGNWNVLPRTASPVTAPNPWSVELRHLLDTIERSEAPLRLGKVESVDLQGDGRPEVFIQAGHTEWVGACRKSVTTACRTNDTAYDSAKSYALLAVAVDSKGPLQVVTRWTGGVSTTINFIFFADVDGDEALEVIVGTSYYEGHDVSIYSLRGSRLEQVLSWECGV